jgi:hypothetical protein
MAQVLPYGEGLKIEPIFDSAVELGDLEQSPSGELWLLERVTGVIRVVDAGVEVATLTIPVGTVICDGGLLDVAFAPDHAVSGLAFVSYVDDTGLAQVVEVTYAGKTLTLGGGIITGGTTGTGCNGGGGLAMGTDGKLYVAFGDLGTPANGQTDGTNAGKVLQYDPATGTTVQWAKGVRNGRDLAVDSSGGLYFADTGEVDVHDELNQIVENGNYGWSPDHGDTGGAFDDPLASRMPSMGCEAVAALADTGLGTNHADSLIFNQTVLVEHDPPVDDEHDLLHEWTAGGTGSVLFDADRGEYLVDPLCPRHIDAVMEGGEGWLYLANSGDNPGVYRVWKDDDGPREVSAAGSPFHLTVDKQGADLLVGWENLGIIDVGPPLHSAGQHDKAYQVWEGTLPIDDPTDYDHAVLEQTDGTADGPARLTELLTTAGMGNHYYLVTAQGDNMEGSPGFSSLPAPNDERPFGWTDYCENVGYGWSPGQCAKAWYDPRDGVTEIGLVDYNPRSPTYLQTLYMSDFRGKVVKTDLSATDCYWCSYQAFAHIPNDKKYRERDLQMITVMAYSYIGIPAIPTGDCASEILFWSNTYKEIHPILCDTDLDGNGKADVSDQINQGGCGTPQNLYVDQGGMPYHYQCGAYGDWPTMEADLMDEVNPRFCE